MGKTRGAAEPLVRTLPGATFKWSRDNGSAVFPVESLNGAVVKVTTLGRDGKLGLEVGDRVELVDEAWAGRIADDLPIGDPTRSSPRIRQVVAIDEADLLVTLDQQNGDAQCQLAQPAFLRRWDHQPVIAPGSGPGSGGCGGNTGGGSGSDGASGGGSSASAVPVIASDGALPLVEGQWLTIEDGVQVWFQPDSTLTGDQGDNQTGTYRRGDWWYVPARVVTGDVQWPQGPDGPAPVAPDGVEYHYAPLAFVTGATVDSSLLKTFPPLAG
ncbi:DUF6519 domain-containing protein [Catenulispora yoronensis]